MAAPAKSRMTPTKVATRVCRACIGNIVINNHPLDMFGAKASQENIPSLLERFFEIKIDKSDRLPSFICRCCYRQVLK